MPRLQINASLLPQENHILQGSGLSGTLCVFVCMYMSYLGPKCGFPVCVWVCSVPKTRNWKYLSSPQTASHTGSFPKLGLLQHKLIVTSDDLSMGKDPCRWKVVHILVIVKDAFSSIRLCCVSLVALENQGTAWAGGLLSKIREAFKMHRNVFKYGAMLDREMQVTHLMVSPASDLHLSRCGRYAKNRESLHGMWRMCQEMRG